TTTFNWFADDEWRFEMFSRYYAPLFDWISTTDFRSVEKYRKIGYKNVIKTGWACNNFLYRQNRQDRLKIFEHDVSFIGKAYGDRPKLVNLIKNAKINVECWGAGWQRGRASQRDMLRIFSRSKINLNFSKMQRNYSLTYALGVLFNRDITNEIHINPLGEWIPRIKYFLKEPANQIKGRVFEIPALGGFLLSEQADKLEDYYVDGNRILFR
ncbi:MAG: glycosyltransferase family protein, partial [Candidatus Micrarchaeaceae archaeon]